MRIVCRRIGWIACVACAAWLAAVAAAQPGVTPLPIKPDAGKDELADERAKLQKQLAELLKQLEKNPPSSGLVSVPKPGPSKHPEPFDPSVDTLRAGMNLFRTNDFDGALRAFRLQDSSLLTREDRAFSQYMQACCLRHLKKSGEAIALYREIADAKEDEFVADMAIWQLSLLRSSQEIESQIEQIRSKQKSR